MGLFFVFSNFSDFFFFFHSGGEEEGRETEKGTPDVALHFRVRDRFLRIGLVLVRVKDFGI